MKKDKPGRPREYNYEGKKKITSIRLTDEEKGIILMEFVSVQAFIQDGIDRIKKPQ